MGASTGRETQCLLPGPLQPESSYTEQLELSLQHARDAQALPTSSCSLRPLILKVSSLPAPARPTCHLEFRAQEASLNPSA